jgi:hypothetical protein
LIEIDIHQLQFVQFWLIVIQIFDHGPPVLEIDGGGAFGFMFVYNVVFIFHVIMLTMLYLYQSGYIS